jgi:hypothetical protein
MTSQQQHQTKSLTQSSATRLHRQPCTKNTSLTFTTSSARATGLNVRFRTTCPHHSHHLYSANIQPPLIIIKSRHQFHSTSWDTTWQHTTTENRHQSAFGTSFICNSTNQRVATISTTRTQSTSTDPWNLQESTKQVGATKWKNHHNNKITKSGTKYKSHTLTTSRNSTQNNTL